MQLWLIPLLPLAGFLINGIFGRRFSKSLINTVAIGSVVLSFAWVLKTIAGMGDLNGSVSEHYFTWIQSGAIDIGCDFFVDRLTIGLLLMVGACGKSAQIPLYVWLPDAMAGPTPVSALIHAATMVTAGVYMTARSWVIYTHAPGAMDIIAIIGIATAFFAATIGLAQNDIKKV